MRSDLIKRGVERAPHRSLLRATGSIESEADFESPVYRQLLRNALAWQPPVDGASPAQP